jgi:hypothetical protein
MTNVQGPKCLRTATKDTGPGFSLVHFVGKVAFDVSEDQTAWVVSNRCPPHPALSPSGGEGEVAIGLELLDGSSVSGCSELSLEKLVVFRDWLKINLEGGQNFRIELLYMIVVKALAQQKKVNPYL